MLLREILGAFGDESDGAGGGDVFPELAQNLGGVWRVEEMHVVNGEDERCAVRGVGRVEVSVQGVAKLVSGFGRAPAGVPAVENAEEESGGGEFGADNVGAGDGGREGAKSGLDEESESKVVAGSRDERAGVLHGDLPQPHIGVAAVADVNQNKRRRLNHRGGDARQHFWQAKAVFRAPARLLSHRPAGQWA